MEGHRSFVDAVVDSQPVVEDSHLVVRAGIDPEEGPRILVPHEADLDCRDQAEEGLDCSLGGEGESFHLVALHAADSRLVEVDNLLAEVDSRLEVDIGLEEDRSPVVVSLATNVSNSAGCGGAVVLRLGGGPP